MIAGDLYYLMLILFSTGIVSVFFTSNNAKLTNYIAHSIALLGSIAAVLCAIFVFVQGKVDVSLPVALPLGPMSASIDYLSAYFLLIQGW